MKFSLLKLIFFLVHSTMLYEGEGGGGFMGQGGSGGTGDPAPGAGDPNPGPEYKYPEGLDNSFHGNPTLLKYANEDGSFNNANIMKSLIHATSQMGADKMVVPNDKFTDEQWKETYQKLGVPADIADYTINNSLEEGQTANEEMFNGFKAKAHELGIHPKQAQGVLDYFNTTATVQMKAGDDTWKAGVQAEVDSLKGEWGEAFDGNIQKAENAFAHLIPDEADRKAIIDTGLLNRSSVTKLFHRLAEGLQEDGFDHQVKGSYGASPAELDGAIATTHGELTRMGKGHPQYASKLAEYQNLFNKKHGTKAHGTRG